MDGTTYTYTTTTTTGPVDYAMAAGVMVGTFIFFALVYVITALLLGLIFKKFGEPAWKAWVPVYNNWVMLELGDQAGWWSILMFIPIVNIVAVVFTYIAYYKIGLKLGKPGAFVLWAIFLPIVWVIWLAVDKSRPVADGDANQIGSQPPVPLAPTTPAM